MTQEEHPIRELLPLYVFGMLALEETAAVDEHLKNCVDCRAELQVLREVSAEIPNALSGPAPNPSLKQRIMSSIQVHAGNPEQAAEGIFVLRDYAWKPSPFPGVHYQILYMDRETRMVTSLLKLAPGSTYPAHEHAAAEQSYVIEGSCHIGGIALKKGEFAYAAAGTEHGVLHTNEGCLLLIVSSQHDKIRV